MTERSQTHSSAAALSLYDCRDQSSIMLSQLVSFSIGYFCYVMIQGEAYARSAMISYCLLRAVLSSIKWKLMFHCAGLSRRFLKFQRCSAVPDRPLLILFKQSKLYDVIPQSLMQLKLGHFTGNLSSW